MRPRLSYIKHNILKYYRSMPKHLISLPFDIIGSIQYCNNCIIMTYREYAERIGVSIAEVIGYNESEDGATHYDRYDGNYVILYNDDLSHNCRERQLFTIAHEVGHMLLGHLPYSEEQRIAKDNFNHSDDPLLEMEADWCGGMLLCPFPVLKEMNIKSPAEIRRLCNLSGQASEIKFEQYTNWLSTRVKTAWESNIKRLFSEFIDSNTVPHM